MKLFYVWCEYDVGLNLTGDRGCYSSQKAVDLALDKAQQIAGENFEALIDEDLLGIEVVEG
jgi:hypothetical protein